MRELDHINLIVPNLNDTVNWYKQLGFEIIAEFNLHKKFVYISNGAVTYELFEDSSIKESYVGHICYKSNDIKKDYENLKGKVEFTVELKYLEGLWENGVDIFLFKGPNNEIIEFLQRR